MKKSSYFLMLAGIMMLAACSSDDGEFGIEESQPLTIDMKIIGVGLPGSETTRVHMNELTDMVWTVGDHLDVYGYNGSKCSPAMPFELMAGEGTATGAFAGQMLTGWDKYEITYKGANISYSPDVENSYPRYSYLEQTQTAMNSFEHIRDHLLLRSPKVSDDATSHIIRLSPQCSILKVNVRNLPAEIADAEACDVIFYLTNPPKSRIRNARVHLTGKFAADSDNFIYMTFEPGHDLDAGGELSIGFDVAGKEYKASVTSKNGKNYEPGVIYTVTLDYNDPGGWTWLMPAM